MTTDTIQKPKLNLKWMDAPIESDKWRNMYFSKSGEWDWGALIHPTEKAAWEGIKKFESGDKPAWLCRGKALLKSRYSHAFPVPIKS